MNIGFASPVTLQILSHLVTDGEKFPCGYPFAPAAAWVQELMKRGHHVTIYTTAKDIEESKTFCGEGLSIRIARARSRGAGRDFFRSERDMLKQMMIEDQCEIIHAHWTYQFALAALSSGIPTLITIHDLPWQILRYFRDPYRVVRLLMAYEVGFRGKHFTAVSEDAAVHFRRYFKPGAKIQVIPNGLSSEVFEMGKQPVEKSDGGITFATVLQGWSRRKNATVALKAFRIVQHEVPDARLLMFGIDFEQGGSAQQWAGQQNLDTGVSFVGVLPYEELLKRMHEDVDVIVHPSLDEAFSMTGLESLALRKVFIAGKDTPGMREMLASGDAGVLVDMKDPAALAEAMIHLARDDGYRTRVARSGYERASTHYTLEAVMNQYEALYRSVLRA